MLFLHLLFCGIALSMSATDSPLMELKSEDKTMTEVCVNESLREDINNMKQQLSQETLTRLSLVNQMSVFVNDLIILTVKNDMSKSLVKIHELENNIADLRLENQRLEKKLDEHILEKEKDDNIKLQMIKELKKDLRNMTFTVDSLRPQMLPSFHARLSRSVRKIGFFQTIIFDLEVVDTTNSYDPRSGIFTAPVTGTYVFYWNILSNEASGMDTTLDSSQGPLGFGFVSHAVNYGNGGNLVIANLTSGTHVWVKKADKYGNYIHERFSTFSGYLLQASG